jgi:GT2 family glycosyltransferase
MTERRPLISVVLAVWETDPAVLKAALDSVTGQTFSDWQLCVVDDASASTVPGDLIGRLASDPRVKVHRREERGGIAATTADALALATGEFVTFMDHDDVLHPDALAWIAHAIAQHQDVDLLYTDEDKIDVAGRHYDVFHKPGWSPDRLLGQNYVGHLAVYRRSLVERVGGIRTGFEGSQDYDLVLRASEHVRRVVHIPQVLYHWRAVAGSAASDPFAKPYALSAARRAIAEHCERLGIGGVVTSHAQNPSIHVVQPLTREDPPVSIVIPTGGMRRPIGGLDDPLIIRCVETIVEMSSYPAYEIICVADATVDTELKERLRAIAGDRLRFVAYDEPFNYARKITIGVMEAASEYVLLLNDDTEVITPEWIEGLLMFAQQPKVGAVGCKLLFSDERIQHGGVVLGRDGPTHAYSCFPRDTVGYFANALVPANWIAVTAACMMTRKSLFCEVGGLSPRYPVNFNDVDYCFKLRRAGYRIAYTPHVEMFHYESSSREPIALPSEYEMLKSRWEDELVEDPYVGPAFHRDLPYFLPVDAA